MAAIARHACSVLLGETVILIEGPSGSGKSSLMFGLVEQLSRQGLVAGIISDDQTCLEEVENTVVASAPEEIAGKAELRGYGIIGIRPVQTDLPVSLIVRLVSDNVIERMPQEKTQEVLGVELPCVEVPVRHETAAVRIVLAWLRDHTGLCLPSP